MRDVGVRLYLCSVIKGCMTEKIIQIEKRMSRSEIAETLNSIAEGLEKGEITVESGNESVELRPSDNPEFEIEVEEEQDGEMSLEIEIEWHPEASGEDELNIQ